MSAEKVQFTVIIEKGESSFGAYVPDLPGCVAVGATRDEARRLIQEAIAFHLEDMRTAGIPIPVPTTSIELVEIAA